jgi:hypothetical protein
MSSCEALEPAAAGAPGETVQRTQLRCAFDQIVHALPMNLQDRTAIACFLKLPISVGAYGPP